MPQSCHTFFFSILVVLLPIEKSIMILMSPLCMFALFGEVLITGVHMCARSVVLVIFFLQSSVVSKNVAARNRLVYM